MRGFIKSLPGKAVGQLVIFALLLPTLTLALARTASAQLTQQATWAVLPFTVAPAAAGIPNLGTTAADAVAAELARTNNYDIVPMETITRAAQTLGTPLPATDPTSISRLSQEVRATTVVVGNVISYRIDPVGGGKQAVVGINVEVRDVASGLPINGAAVSGKSTVRVGDVTDETIVSEALNMAAIQAVATIKSQILPTATVLNTTVERILLNQGERTGFKVGQHVIVTRGREQVATATIIDTEPDQCYMRPDRIIKGIQPGDKVRVVFNAPVGQGLKPNGDLITKPTPRRTSSSGLISTILILGLVVGLLSGGRNSNNSGVTQLTAQAELFPASTGVPSVELKWGADVFHQANSQRAQWQIYRSDVIDSPVLVVSGNTFIAHDASGQTRNIQFAGPAEFGRIGGSTCDFQSPPYTTGTPSGPSAGQAYQYSIELIYTLTSNDLPPVTNGSTTGTTNTGTTNTGTSNTGTSNTGTTNTGTTNTGTTNTGTTNTGTTNGGNTGTTSGASNCYFLSDRTNATGLATPLVRVTGSAPTQNASIPPFDPNDITSQTVQFAFSSANTAGNLLTLEYVVEVSLNPTFPKGSILVGQPVVSNDTNSVSLTAPNNFFQNVAPQTKIYWRVGVRNVVDVPGPVPDPSGYRYIFGPAQFFVRGEAPPPPPVQAMASR